ncbi:hypothetical protein ACFSQ7_10305 [Paenibacillus rhizoplanae]
MPSFKLDDGMSKFFYWEKVNYPSTLEVKYSEVKPLELDGLERAEMINEEQLRQIMKLYGEDVWNYIYFSDQKNSDQADELTQEVFIKCFYRIRTYRGASSLKKPGCSRLPEIRYSPTANRGFPLRAVGRNATVTR